MRGITLRLYVRIQQVLARLGLKLPGKIISCSEIWGML